MGGWVAYLVVEGAAEEGGECVVMGVVHRGLDLGDGPVGVGGWVGGWVGG